MGQAHRQLKRQPRQTTCLPPPKLDLTYLERCLIKDGYTIIAGVDEAGRGCLAGPVVAASVILPGDLIIEGINDSKKLTAKQRDRYYDEVRAQAVAWAWSAVDAGEIDRINILQATLKAMRASVKQLEAKPQFLLIDGMQCIDIDIPQQALKKGDGRSQSIAAASVIAKVTRDRLMCDYAKTYPRFSFHVHKGYGTQLHLDELGQHGPTPIHRMTFRGVPAFDVASLSGK